MKEKIESCWAQDCRASIFVTSFSLLGDAITTGIGSFVYDGQLQVLIRKYGIQSIQHGLNGERQSWTLRVEGSMSRLGDVPSTPTTWKKLEKLFHKLQPNFIDHQSWRKAQIAMNKGGQFGNWHQHARYSAGEMPNLRHAKKQLKKGQRATKIWQEKTHLKNGLKGHSCLLLENGIPRSILK